MNTQERLDLIWLHVIGDGAVAIACFVVLALLLRYREGVRSRIEAGWAFASFAAFAALNGFARTLDVLAPRYPVEDLQAGVGALAAIATLAAAVAVVRLIPRLLRTQPPSELALANERLRAEVAARERAEAERQRSLSDLARAVKELEQFAYVTSHDLQAPLRNVAGFSQLLSRRYADKLDGDALEFLQFIDQGVRQMQALILDLLQLSRVGRTETRVECRPLDEPLRAALKILDPEISASNAEVSFGTLPAIPATPSLMIQLFQNLIGNAIKFQVAGQQPQIRVEAEVEDRHLHLRVCDNGIGIPADQLENVFVVFRRLHNAEEYEGTGIGLAICRKIVQHHRGEIWAESDTGGTTMHVRLPLENGISSDRAAVTPDGRG